MIKALLLSAFLATTCEVGPFPKPAPQPEPPTPWDDSITAGAAPTGQAEMICSNLHTQKCPEGDSIATCVSVVQHTLDTKLTRVPAQCLIGAQSPQAVHACGFVTCEAKQ